MRDARTRDGAVAICLTRHADRYSLPPPRGWGYSVTRVFLIGFAGPAPRAATCLCLAVLSPHSFPNCRSEYSRPGGRASLVVLSSAVDDFEPGNRIMRGEITGGHQGAVRTSNTEGTGERHRRRGSSASWTRRAGSALLLIDRSTAWQPADRARRGGVDVHAAQARPSRIAGRS